MAAEFGGGGFGSQDFGPSASQMGGGFTDNSMGFSQTPAKKAFANQSLHPCTFKQLTQVTQPQDGGNPMLNGKEMSQVKVVGLVRGVQSQSTFTNYEMDDGTATMQVKSWMAPEEATKIAQNSYAVACGKLSFFEGRAQFTCFHIRPVEDHNEITYHMLAAMHAHRCAKNVKPSTFEQPNFGGQTTNQNAGFGANNNFGSNDASFGGGSFGGGNQNFGGGAVNDYQNDQMSPLQNQILQVIMQNKSDEGMHFDEVVQRTNGAGLNDIREAVEWLVNEGQLYSTIDDDHFKATSE